MGRSGRLKGREHWGFGGCAVKMDDGDNLQTITRLFPGASLTNGTEVKAQLLIYLRCVALIYRPVAYSYRLTVFQRKSNPPETDTSRFRVSQTKIYKPQTSQ